MSELTSAVQASSPVILGNFGHPGIRLNGSSHVIQPLRHHCVTPEPDDISLAEIREELEHILESPEFKEKPMLRGFLSFVVAETLAGRVHEIKGYTVATQVFGRRVDFNPTIDPIVRIQAGRLRRTLESYYSGQGRHDRLRIEIGKGSYVPTFSRFNPEKEKPGQTRKAAELQPPDMGLCREPRGISPNLTWEGPSIAVMPLANLTNDPEQEYLADGLTEELMNELACCRGLRVHASHSTIKWKEKSVEARQIGRELGVRFLLEGSLRKAGQTVKFTIRLIDTATGLQIWGEQFKRGLGSDKAIDLQEEIARSVAGRIGGLFRAIPKRLSTESRTKSSLPPGAYDASLTFSQYQTGSYWKDCEKPVLKFE